MSKSADREGRRKAEEGKWSMDEDFTEQEGTPVARLVAEIRDKRPNGEFTLSREEAWKRAMKAFIEQHNDWLREGNIPADETA